MRPLDGYPTSFGSSRASVFPHQGPVLYAPVAAGAAPALATGGDLVEAGPEAGMKYFDWVSAGLSDSGTYRVEAAPVAESGDPDNPTKLGQPSTTYRLRWIVVATGAQAAAVDLSAEVVRLFAIGPK
jgi:hypothetical protein